MRTSSQLDKVSRCEHNKTTNLVSVSDRMNLAGAQKNIIKRVMQGEPIPDIAAELDSILVACNYPWENYEQRVSTLDRLNKRIKRYLEFEQRRSHIFPNEQMDMVVDFFGEPVEAKPDFFVDDGQNVFVCRIRTSRMAKKLEEVAEREEGYALGLCGEKNFPGRKVYLQYLYLAESSADYEKKSFETSLPYEVIQRKEYSKIAEYAFDDKIKEYFEKKNAEMQEEKIECSPEECATCAMNNVCHFEEAPIQVPTETGGVPLENIRLKKEQRDVVEVETGIARVNAGAGAGKTLVTAARIVRLLEKGYQPEDFCLLTFTKAGAREMTSRVMRLAAMKGMPIDPDRFTAGTINSFCQNIITENYAILGYSRPPRCIEPDDARRYAIINEIIDTYPKIKSWDYSAPTKVPNMLYSKNPINRFKAALDVIKKYEIDSPENLPVEITKYFNPTTAEEDSKTLMDMFYAYEKMKKDRCYVEYDDQLRLVMKLGTIKPSLYEDMKFKHILVDEFQDTDLPQIKLLNKIIDTSNFVSFMAVGDDSQSIFAFRDTSPEYMIHFDEYFGRYKDYPLVENHRSGKAIIDFANKINAEAMDRIEKDLIPTRPTTVMPTIQGYYTENQEYKAIAESIKKKWDASENLPDEEKRKARDIAVLGCTKIELTAIASELTKLGIPSVLMNPVPYLQNSRVAALNSFYNAYTGKGNQGFLDYQNALAHGEIKNASGAQMELIANNFALELMNTEKTVGKFKEFAAKLDEQEQDECYQSFIENVNDCESMEELMDFFDTFQLYGEDSTFKKEGKYEGISLITIHSAKGLEWNTTYLTVSKLDKASYHTNSRNYRTRKGADGRDENIRKYFVGATRAREELIITGQYQLKSGTKKDGNLTLYDNEFLRMGYKFLDKVWDYNLSEKLAQKAKEKAEKSEKEIKFEPNFGYAALKKDVGKNIFELEKEMKKKEKDAKKKDKTPEAKKPPKNPDNKEEKQENTSLEDME